MSTKTVRSIHLILHKALADATAELGSPRRTMPGLVFTKADGGQINPDCFSQLHDRTVKTAKLPRIVLHDLRHTHASLLLKAGVPIKVVSERLGHANAAFTMTVYQHIIPGMQAEAANTFAELLDDPAEQADNATQTGDPTGE